MVLDRKHRAKSGKSALRFRKARASYGVITEERYDKRLEAHAGKHPVISKIDGCEMVENRVVWVIKKVSRYTTALHLELMLKAGDRATI